MRSEWKECNLGEILSFANGRSSPERSDESPYKVYGSNGEIGRADKTNADKNSIIIGRVGTYCGSTYICDEECWVTDNAIKANAKKGNDSKFCFYLLNTLNLNNHATGSGQPLLNQSILSSIEACVPPLAEQKAIAHILGSLDDKIELNRKMNATLEAMAQALFKSWFVDFDPVIDNALAAGNPIPDEFAPRADIRRQALANNPTPNPHNHLFPATFTPTESLGWIPEGWKVGCITDLAKLNPEAWTNRKHPEAVLYIDLANTKDGRINETVPYTFDEAPSRARRVLRSHDTILGTVRPGNRSFAYIHNDGLTGSTGFAVLRPRTVSSRAFVYLCLTQDDIIDTFSHLADGGAYPAIRPEVVGNTQIPLPSKEILEVFEENASKMITKIGEHQNENTTLTALRDTLLPKLISGELTFKN